MPLNTISVFMPHPSAFTVVLIFFGKALIMERACSKEELISNLTDYFQQKPTALHRRVY